MIEVKIKTILNSQRPPPHRAPYSCATTLRARQQGAPHAHTYSRAPCTSCTLSTDLIRNYGESMVNIKLVVNISGEYGLIFTTEGKWGNVCR